MKRKRLLLILICLASVLLSGYLALRLMSLSNDKITQENFDKIKLGMTENEVEALLGGPAGVYTFKAITGQYSVRGGRQRDVMIDESRWTLGRGFAILSGLDLIKEKGGKEWVAEEYAVFVRFDEHGRVVESEWSWFGVIENESFLARLRRWLDM
jgi:outer membrane protein assembly factor BamE (lipoprotein component of BamABCDE complex)